MISRFSKFYVRCAPGHTDTCHLEISNILKKWKGKGLNVNVEKERELGKTSKNGLYVNSKVFKHGVEIAMKSLTIQDIECVILDEICKSKRDVRRRLKKIQFAEIIPHHSFSNIDDFLLSFKLHSRANKSIVNSSRFLKEEFCNALEASGVLTKTLTDRVRPNEFVDETEDAPRLLNVIRLSLLENRLIVAVSLAGEMELYKRTYKDLTGVAVAPLPEHHASACIQWALSTVHNEVYSSYTPSRITLNNIIVPFAGTGTLGFESLLVLLDCTAGSGLFNERKFAFDSFPCSSHGNDMKASQHFREQMKSEVTSKLLNVSEDKHCDVSEHIPHMQKSTKILFSDVNDDALTSCEANISSFIHSSGNVFSSSLFLKPIHLDFLKENISSILCHAGKVEGDDNLDTGCDIMSNYTNGTTLILLNPPFGMRLAKKSSTISLYSQIANQLIAMRDKIQTLRQPAPTTIPRTNDSTTIDMMGLCLCPDMATWSSFITALSGADFTCKTSHFSLGGNDMRAVCFWSNE